MEKRIEFVLTREELEALSPCDAEKYWSESPRREPHPLVKGQEVLVYREGWVDEMAATRPGALVWMGIKKLGGIDEPAARAAIKRVREAAQAAKAAAATAEEPTTTVVE